MGYFRQILSGDAQEVRVVEEADGHHHAPGADRTLVRYHPKVVAFALHAQDALVQAQRQAFVLGYAAVVFDGFLAKRLLPVYRERMPPYFDQFGRGEEFHLHGIPDEGLGDGSFLHDEGAQPFPLRLNGAGQPHRAAADDDYVRHGLCTGKLRRKIVQERLRIVHGQLYK